MSCLYKVLKNASITYEQQPCYIGGDKTNKERDVSRQMVRNFHNRQKELEEKLKNADAEIEAMVRSRSDDLDKKVNTIIEQARGDCKNILKIKTEEGFAEGMKVAEARYAEFDDYFENLKNKITDECKNDNKVIEENILDIAFILARRIIDIQLERSDTAILSALKDVVGKFKEENGISIDVSENVAKRLKKDEYKQLYKVNVNKELSDEEILLNSNFGIVEASIDTQLDNLKKALLEECKKI